MDEEKEIVKYDGKWWVLYKENDNGTYELWSNGQPALVPTKDIERFNKDKNNK